MFNVELKGPKAATEEVTFKNILIQTAFKNI
jgi:hypothetical protein